MAQEFYTKEEIGQLESIKRALANRHVYRSPRPVRWNQEEILNVMKHNVCTVPIDAARFASEGRYHVAAAILRNVTDSLKYIQGLEDGTMEYRDQHFYNSITGELIS